MFKNIAGTVVTVNCRLSDTANNQRSIEVFPNPTNGMVTLKFISKENQNCELLLTDVTGREVIHKQLTFSTGINEHTFDMSNLSKGVYLIVYLHSLPPLRGDYAETGATTILSNENHLW